MRVVLDASAILAALKGEKGAELVGSLLDTAVASTVNLAEVVSVLTRGNSRDAVLRILDIVPIIIMPADEAMAIDAGLLAPVTAKAGLSLGDRFCLALGRRLGVPVVTADRAWAEIADAAGVEVQLIR